MEAYKHKENNNEILLDLANRYANEYISWFESKIEYYCHHGRRSRFYCIILYIRALIRCRQIKHSLKKAVKNLKLIDSEISKCLKAYDKVISDYLDSLLKERNNENDN